MKLRESRCADCMVKIVQSGKGKTAKYCKGCRDRRAKEWHEGKDTKPKGDLKRINPVGDDT